MSFFDSTLGGELPSRPHFWDDPLDLAGPKAELYARVRLGLVLALALAIVGAASFML